MLTKYLMPLIAVIAFAGGSYFGAKVLTKKCPDCSPVFKCPELPEQKPCNGIDFDKIKSRNITIENRQYLTIDGDSVLVDNIIKGVRAEMEKLRLSRCK